MCDFWACPGDRRGGTKSDAPDQLVGEKAKLRNRGGRILVKINSDVAFAQSCSLLQGLRDPCLSQQHRHGFGIALFQKKSLDNGNSQDGARVNVIRLTL